METRGCYGGEGRSISSAQSVEGGPALWPSWPPAPDGCIDAHPSSRAAGATGRVHVHVTGVRRDWDTQP